MNSLTTMNPTTARRLRSPRGFLRAAPWLGALVLVLLSRVASAAPTECVNACDGAMNLCTQTKASGCALAGKATQKLVSEAASRIPIPGAGLLVSSGAGALTEQQCAEAVTVCESIRTTCYAECGVVLDGATGAITAAVASAPPLRATLRVFSSSPRSLVYVNEQRLGATPDDTLEPFVTPQLAVGRYWIRVVSTDGELEWEGEKEVLDGNVNSLEATLGSAEESIWGRAIASMARGDLPAARVSCETYRLRFAMGVHIDEAIELLRAIDRALVTVESELFEQLEAAATAAEFEAANDAYRATMGARGAKRRDVDRLLSVYVSEQTAVEPLLDDVTREAAAEKLRTQEPQFRGRTMVVYRNGGRNHDRAERELVKRLRADHPKLRYYEGPVAALETSVGLRFDPAGKSAKELILLERQKSEEFEAEYSRRVSNIFVYGITFTVVPIPPVGIPMLAVGAHRKRKYGRALKAKYRNGFVP
jgi:hypothetical protein